MFELKVAGWTSSGIAKFLSIFQGYNIYWHARVLTVPDITYEELRLPSWACSMGVTIQAPLRHDSTESNVEGAYTCCISSLSLCPITKQGGYWYNMYSFWPSEKMPQTGWLIVLQPAFIMKSAGHKYFGREHQISSSCTQRSSKEKAGHHLLWADFDLQACCLSIAKSNPQGNIIDTSPGDGPLKIDQPRVHCNLLLLRYGCGYTLCCQTFPELLSVFHSSSYSLHTSQKLN